MQTAQTFQQPTAQQPVYTQQPVVVKEEKNAGMAAILSFFFPGAGQAYNGETGKGIGIIIGTTIGFFIFVFPAVLVWFYGIYDTYTTAQKMNKGEIPYKSTSMGTVIGLIVVDIFIYMAFFLIVIMAFIYAPSPYYSY